MSDDAECKLCGGERSEPQQRRRRRRPARAAGKRRPRSGPDAREEGRSARPSASDRSEAQGAQARGADAGYRRPEERSARSTREEGGNRRSGEAEAAEESEAVRCAPRREDVQPPDEHRTGWGTGQGRGSGGIAARSIRFAPAAIQLRAARRRSGAYANASEPAGA